MNGQVALTDNYRDKRQWSIQVSDKGEKKVESKTLQEIFNDAGINAMNILKMDIEGAEVPIFSLDDSIEKSLVSAEMVGIEVHEKNSIVEKKLKLMGFSCVTEGETLFAEK
jgi:FkbM family methyltransferase